MNQPISRRLFLKNAGIASAGLAVCWNPITHPLYASASENGMLSGFLVSDSHFGWKHQDQPTPQQQREMIDRIMMRFPDIDMFIDTGDAHHNYANDTDRGNWTDIIAGGCGQKPFFYISGNHEMDAFGYDWDPEWRANILGSIQCRPYYSFDVKGIHFISLPQMMNMSYITEESLAWAKLDLQINKDKTTVIFSHNSLKGTTSYLTDIGYRQTSNSRAVFDLIDQYTNVIAWMHGHNHTYEVVPKGNRVFVSNGRIGGFIPGMGKFGQGHLGGFYFEAGPGHFRVRAYSATAEKFLDELPDYKHLSHTIKGKTSLDITAEPIVSYGYGGARDGQRIPVYHHFAGMRKQELILNGTNSPIINENTDFSTYTQRTAKNWYTKHLGGFDIGPLEEDENREDKTWQWLDPGLRIKKRTDPKFVKAIYAPGSAIGQRSYYRCAPGKSYKLHVEIDAHSGGQNVQLVCNIHDRQRQQLLSLQSEIFQAAGGKQKFEHVFDIPNLRQHQTIYRNPMTDNVVQITVAAKFSNLLEPVDVSHFELQFAAGKGQTENPAIVIDGRKYRHEDILAGNQLARFELPKADSLSDDRSVIELYAEGNRRASWLVRQIAPQWQVRNAAVADLGDRFKIDGFRNTFSQNQEIVIAPMQPTTLPYVHRMRHVLKAAIRPAAKDRPDILIDVLKIEKEAQIDIYAETRPGDVIGPYDTTYKNNILTIKTKSAGTIHVEL